MFTKLRSSVGAPHRQICTPNSRTTSGSQVWDMLLAGKCIEFTQASQQCWVDTCHLPDNPAGKAVYKHPVCLHSVTSRTMANGDHAYTLNCASHAHATALTQRPCVHQRLPQINPGCPNLLLLHLPCAQQGAAPISNLAPSGRPARPPPPVPAHSPGILRHHLPCAQQVATLLPTLPPIGQPPPPRPVRAAGRRPFSQFCWDGQHPPPLPNTLT